MPDLRAAAPSEARRDATERTHAPAPAGAEALRALQRRIGNRATGRLIAGGESRPRSLHRQAIQRTILLNGTAFPLHVLLKLANDVREGAIIRNWSASDTDHDFSARTQRDAALKLLAAVKAARGQLADVPGLYRAANLRFLTSTGDRLSTLYFISGADSGRIRQQHGSGPAVVSQTNKTDYFFSSRDGMDSFGDDAREAQRNDEVFTPVLATYNATLTPTDGYNHFEVTYASDGKVLKRHPSGGTCDTAIGDYDDAAIEEIYQKAIGLLK